MSARRPPLPSGDIDWGGETLTAGSITLAAGHYAIAVLVVVDETTQDHPDDDQAAAG